MESKIKGIPFVLIFLVIAITLPILLVVILLHAQLVKELQVVKGGELETRSSVLKQLQITPEPTATPSAAPIPVKRAATVKPVVSPVN